MADHDSDDPRTWPAVKWPGIELVRVRDTPTGDWRLVGLRFIHDGGGRTEVAVSADVLPEIIEAVAQASCWLRWGRYAPKAAKSINSGDLEGHLNCYDLASGCAGHGRS